MEEKADIAFDYEEGLKKGKKVISIIFHLHKNNPSVVEIEDIKADFTEGKTQNYQFKVLLVYYYLNLIIKYKL